MSTFFINAKYRLIKWIIEHNYSFTCHLSKGERFMQVFGTFAFSSFWKPGALTHLFHRVNSCSRWIFEVVFHSRLLQERLVRFSFADPCILMSSISKIIFDGLLTSQQLWVKILLIHRREVQVHYSLTDVLIFIVTFVFTRTLLQATVLRFQAKVAHYAEIVRDDFIQP